MDVKKVAKLANLPLTAAEEKKFTGQLEETLKYIAELSEVDTKSVDPTSQVTGKTNELRDDAVQPTLAQEAALQNAPKKDKGFFKSKVTWE